MGKHNVKAQQKVLLAPTKNRPLAYQYSLSEFFHERFNFFGNTQAAIISGGTYSNGSSDDAHGVLDASVTDYIYDKHGVRVGLAMATADGLGHSVDETENRSTALVSLSACERFVNKCKNLTSLGINRMKQIMQEAGTESRESKLSPAFDSKSSLAATAIYRQPNGTLKAVIGNVGDGMILVIDGKTGKIKHTVAARDYGHYQIGGSNQYSPYSVQDLTKENSASIGEFVEFDDVNEDDLIIQLTDGIWGEFESTKDQKVIGDKTYREQKIASEAFERILKYLSSASAFAIGQAIVMTLSQSTLEKRQQFQKLMQALQPFSETLLAKQFANREEYEAYTISVWIREIHESGDNGPQIAALLSQYLEESEHDGIHYNIDTCPAQMLVRDLQRKGFGDCATIAMMRVPNYKKELIRALMINPEHRQALLARIEEEIQPNELDDIIMSLSQEQFLPTLPPDGHGNNPGCRYRSLESTYQFTFPLLQQANLYVKALVNESPTLDKSVLLEKLRTRFKSDASLDLAQMSAIFDICSLRGDLFNTHQNPNWDRFFGIRNTRTWGETVKEIRDFALTKLFDEVDRNENIEEKIKLLEWAKSQPLFNQHRSNFLITGAWGNTSAVSAIEDKLEELKTDTTFELS